MKKFTLSVLSFMLAVSLTATAQTPSINPTEFKMDTSKTGVTKAARDSSWTKGGVASAALSQVSLTNWAAGGDGLIAFDLMFNYNLNYQKTRHLWQNRLELAYGMNSSDSKGTQKTNDKIYLASMYGYELGKNWYAAALLNFSTQFANGYDYSTVPKKYRSRFMAPGYLSAGVGFAWKPKKWFTATLSPAMWRGTFVLDDDLFFDGNNKPINAYGVEHGKHMLNEFGANVRLEVNYDITKSINLYSRLDLYSNYLKNPQNVDVRWDIVMTAIITKWFSANLTLNMIYDDDIKFQRADGTMGGSKFQIKEILGIGLQAAF